MNISTLFKRGVLQCVISCRRVSNRLNVIHHLNVLNRNLSTPSTPSCIKPFACSKLCSIATPCVKSVKCTQLCCENVVVNASVYRDTVVKKYLITHEKFTENFASSFKKMFDISKIPKELIQHIDNINISKIEYAQLRVICAKVNYVRTLIKPTMTKNPPVLNLFSIIQEMDHEMNSAFVKTTHRFYPSKPSDELINYAMCEQLMKPVEQDYTINLAVWALDAIIEAPNYKLKEYMFKEFSLPINDAFILLKIDGFNNNRSVSLPE